MRYSEKLMPIGILASIILTVFGIFVPHDSISYWDYSLALGLPLWIITTLCYVNCLTATKFRDIVKSVDEYI
jgi:ABC-type polysaccharide/polyol phosphate export permease